MRRVISVTTDRKPGGIATALISYSRALKLAGYRHLVLLPNGASAIAALTDEPNVELISFPLALLKFHIQTCFIFCPSLRTALPDASAMLIHNARHIPYLKRLSIPQFCVNHSGKLRYLSTAKNILFLSSAAQARAQNHFQEQGITHTKQPNSFVLAHGFMLPAQPARKRRRNTIPVIIAAGRFVEKKGFADLLDAAAFLQDKNIPCKIELYGAGPLASAYRAQIDRLSLTNLTLKGWAENLPRYFTQADIFCLPSHEEPFGLILAEAMLAGLPVVASNTDGPSDILGKNTKQGTDSLAYGGLLYQRGDSKALAKALAILIEDKTLRQKAGDNAERHIRTHYSLDQQAEALSAILASAER